MCAKIKMQCQIIYYKDYDDAVEQAKPQVAFGKKPALHTETELGAIRIISTSATN